MRRTIFSAIGLASALFPAMVSAQPAPPAPYLLPPPAVTVRDPLALPGDNLPPAMSVVLTPPTPPSLAPSTPPLLVPARQAVPGPSMAFALIAAQAALARCEADGLKVGVAVSDTAGVVVVGLQMDGANPGRIFFAGRKNLAAIEFGLPSSAVRDKLRAGDFATLSRTKPNMVLFAGAVPLIAQGKVIGAIAVSGATGAQDEVCAAAGAAAVAGRL